MATAAVEIPPSNHGIPGSHMLQHVRLPEVAPQSPETIDPQRAAGAWLDAFNALLDGQATNMDKVFLGDCYWRDLLCLTWNFHTFHGIPKVSDALKSRGKPCPLKKLSIDSSTANKKPAVCSIDFKGNLQGIRAFLTFDTNTGRGRGLVKLVQDVRDGGRWKAFTLFTTLEEIKGHEEPTYARRPNGVDHGAHAGRLNWQERRRVEANCEGAFEPTVLVIGKSAFKRGTQNDSSDSLKVLDKEA
ncbi:MAG: hypothetical protein Q9222_004624 [Ikaeria aurantiellina]